MTFLFRREQLNVHSKQKKPRQHLLFTNVYIHWKWRCEPGTCDFTRFHNIYTCFSTEQPPAACAGRGARHVTCNVEPGGWSWIAHGTHGIGRIYQTVGFTWRGAWKTMAKYCRFDLGNQGMLLIIGKDARLLDDFVHRRWLVDSEWGRCVEYFEASTWFSSDMQLHIYARHKHRIIWNHWQYTVRIQTIHPLLSEFLNLGMSTVRERKT